MPSAFASIDQNGNLTPHDLSLPALTPGWELIPPLQWTCYILYSDHGRSNRSQTLSGSQQTWDPIKLPLDQIAQVGLLTVDVTFTVEDSGTGATEKRSLTYSGVISGTNPSNTSILGELADISLQVLCFMESTLRQFDATYGNTGMPVWHQDTSGGGGFGLMQLTNSPVPSIEELSNWHKNLAGGVKRWGDLRNVVNQHFANLRKTYATLPAPTSEQVLGSMHQAYEFGTAPSVFYVVPNATNDGWVKDPNPNCTKRGDAALNYEAQVRAGTPPWGSQIAQAETVPNSSLTRIAPLIRQVRFLRRLFRFLRVPENPYRPFRIHIVRKGDTLWRLARDTYGSGALYTIIFEANRSLIKNPNLIYVGWALVVPRLDNCLKYTIKSGDTLKGLAKRYYGASSEEQYRLIFAANRNVLKTPNQIAPGEVLRIPLAPVGPPYPKIHALQQQTLVTDRPNPYTWHDESDGYWYSEWKDNQGTIWKYQFYDQEMQHETGFVGRCEPEYSDENGNTFQNQTIYYNNQVVSPSTIVETGIGAGNPLPIGNGSTPGDDGGTWNSTGDDNGNTSVDLQTQSSECKINFQNGPNQSQDDHNSSGGYNSSTVTDSSDDTAKVTTDDSGKTTADVKDSTGADQGQISVDADGKATQSDGTDLGNIDQKNSEGVPGEQPVPLPDPPDSHDDHDDGSQHDDHDDTHDDAAHDDAAHDDTAHDDAAHDDAAHDDTAHDDATHDDQPHDDQPHDDQPHDDQPPPHDDQPYDDAPFDDFAGERKINDR